ncbi:MAG: metal-sulfur cluster assembly factor [Neisseriaceae bacterium]|jgi:metal-sulfur cluster biosynthetic enzyme|nr:hypothetical protein [Pseudomonadota bacterium]RTL01776.1 MAG: metal-sulfur cluster assembly factor [Neisseriaceae bacterium]
MNLDTPAQQEQDQVRDILRKVVDPEVGINIVELGLIYRIESMPAHVLIEMTMTSPACPMGDLIEDDARQELARGLPPGRQVELRLVWEPPWDPSMMSESARTHFGW